MTHPTPASSLTYHAKVRLLRWRRSAVELGRLPSRLTKCKADRYPCLVAESRTPLFGETRPEEARLQLGKIQNLRLAAKAFDGLELTSGSVFSFWRQLGPTTRGRGFMDGRQLQEGCLVPQVGGGLCQLSNALYEVALQAGMEIVERHPHSRTIPGSSAAANRDATVAWNYIDLRLATTTSQRLTVDLSSRELIVRLWGTFGSATACGRFASLAAAKGAEPMQMQSARKRPHSQILPLARSCETCGESDCHQNSKLDHREVTGKVAVLVDEVWPEHAAYVTSIGADLLLLPLDGAKSGKPQYGWPTGDFKRVRAFPILTLRRALESRRLQAQGPTRQRALLASSARLANAYARALPFDATHVVVAQTLLPFLWQSGALGGRTFDVLMTRLPMRELQRRLDAAAKQHPGRPTLADFRADENLVAAEQQALQAAAKIITPHAGIAKMFGPRAHRLDWSMPPDRPHTVSSPKVLTQGPHPSVVFPGPTIARKGAQDVRDAARTLNVSVLTLGNELEDPDFWQGIDQRRATPGEEWLATATVVAQPSIAEDRPRPLLRALAIGIPVIACEAFTDHPLLTVVSYGDPAALGQAIDSALS